MKLILLAMAFFAGEASAVINDIDLLFGDNLRLMDIEDYSVNTLKLDHKIDNALDMSIYCNNSIYIIEESDWDRSDCDSTIPSAIYDQKVTSTSSSIIISPRISLTNKVINSTNSKQTFSEFFEKMPTYTLVKTRLSTINQIETIYTTSIRPYTNLGFKIEYTSGLLAPIKSDMISFQNTYNTNPEKAWEGAFLDFYHSYNVMEKYPDLFSLKNLQKLLYAIRTEDEVNKFFGSNHGTLLSAMEVRGKQYIPLDDPYDNNVGFTAVESNVTLGIRYKYNDGPLIVNRQGVTLTGIPLTKSGSPTSHEIIVKKAYNAIFDLIKGYANLLLSTFNTSELERVQILESYILNNDILTSEYANLKRHLGSVDAHVALYAIRDLNRLYAVTRAIEKNISTSSIASPLEILVLQAKDTQIED